MALVVQLELLLETTLNVLDCQTVTDTGHVAQTNYNQHAFETETPRIESTKDSGSFFVFLFFDCYTNEHQLNSAV